MKRERAIRSDARIAGPERAETTDHPRSFVASATPGTGGERP